MAHRLWRLSRLLMGLALLAGLAGCSGGVTYPNAPGVLAVWGTTGLGPGEFSYPRAIAVAPSGELWIIDKAARVCRFTPDGQPAGIWKMPKADNGKPVGLTIDEAGNLWVADTHEHRVLVFSPLFEQRQQIGQFGREPGQFIFPTHVALRGDEVFVAEYGGNDRIQVFSRSGRFLRQFGSPGTGPGQFSRPQRLRFGPDGLLYVADSCNHRISIFTPAGEFVRSIGSPGVNAGELSTPYSFQFLPDGTVAIIEYGTCRVQRMDLTGRSLAVWGRPGKSPGELAYPWDLVFWQSSLAILDSGNNRVQMLDWEKALK